LSRTVGRQKVSWGHQAVEWTAIAVEDGPEPRSAMWSYRLDGLTYFGFPYDPSEEGLMTRARAVNWLNRYHLIVGREYSGVDLLGRDAAEGAID
jgi:hypothetical protein